MNRGGIARHFATGISAIVLASALVLALGIGLSTAPSVQAGSSSGDPSWTVSSQTDWWENQAPENDVRTTRENINIV